MIRSGPFRRNARCFAGALAAALLLATRLLCAAELFVEISDQDGGPVEDAVVSLTALDGRTALPDPPPSTTKSIDQRNEVFVPFLEIFRPGDRLVFQNNDSTRHHVYSFSEVKSFEFVLAKGESSTPILLDRPGVIAIGCNIHDSMIAYVFVSDAPWVGRSDRRGSVHFDKLPAGTYTIALWHPWQTPGEEGAAQHITIDAAVTSVRAAFSLSLLPDPRQPRDRERSIY